MAVDLEAAGSERRQAAPDAADLALLEELRQPIAAASNYLGAVRLLIAPLDNDSCVKAADYLSQAENQLLRAGSIIGRLRAGSKGINAPASP